MLELTKARTTKGFVDFSVRVPEAEADRVLAALKAMVELANGVRFDDERTYSPAEVFGPKNPGRLVRGARGREGWTQAELARRMGTTRSVVCDLENGRRPMSLAMARRLAEVFGVAHTVFL
jgi:DNA-binding XRE family transcriptional regulator